VFNSLLANRGRTMAADSSLIPLTQARRRIHAAAMKLFAQSGDTKVSISELATAAGMARGTIYSHVPDVDRLFEDVAGQLAKEMTELVVAGFAGISDPAQRLAIGVRQYIRRAHEEPLWGRFMSRFGLSPAVMRAVMSSEALTDFESGVALGRYRIASSQVRAMVALLAGGTLAAMLPVLDGHGTWREIGSDTAELLLTALGVDREEARALARSELPPLAGGMAS
jgi:AcrR family transcriptional regulator